MLAWSFDTAQHFQQKLKRSFTDGERIFSLVKDKLLLILPFRNVAI